MFEIRKKETLFEHPAPRHGYVKDTIKEISILESMTAYKDRMNAPHPDNFLM